MSGMGKSAKERKPKSETPQSVPRLLMIGFAITGKIDAIIDRARVFDAVALAANIRYTWVVLMRRHVRLAFNALFRSLLRAYYVMKV